MVKEKTRKFVEENREMLEMVAKHGNTSIRVIAEAMLLATDLDDVKIKENKDGVVPN
ncbi:hypothetical protein AFULGI_00006430 [Archaeoglobus fulgidus DSM 8774]|uniref:Uncharacterized protein n=1 Tax=Archaeoglobus fulgidus DSM 8774 TaxID=1344584 RepID=A0A075WE78_ARCFL|nr:hypothetical protein [Archaeoglobus fulgidus]AIG97444.1 hypothetical protein AFULGI_00006430 [Archaeoglobus fulgidus DSM 8774]